MMINKILRCSVIAAAAVAAFSAGTASADVTWTVAASSTGDLNAAQAGDVITIDITLSNDGTAVFGLGGSIYGADIGAGAVTISGGGGTTSSAALVQFATGPGAGFGGLDSAQAIELDAAGGDAGIQFFNGVSISGTGATGAGDISPLTSATGGPQFQVIVEVASGLADGTYTLDVGAGHPTDGVIGNGGTALGSTEGSVVFTVPEPTTIASSLAAMGTVLGVVGLRRRKS
jgi:hypothetical protein